nr:MAG TPA: hypothetical protein [Caudoviricetes sp.]
MPVLPFYFFKIFIKSFYFSRRFAERDIIVIIGICIKSALLF